MAPPPAAATRPSSAAAPWLVLFASLVGAGLLIMAVFLAFPSAEEKKRSRRGRGQLTRAPTPPLSSPDPTTPSSATREPAGTPAPPLGLVEPTTGRKWELPGGSHLQPTPEFPTTECASQAASDNDTNATMMVAACVMRVPMYVMVMNRVEEAANLTAVASKVNALVQRNATHETRVVIQTVFVDNTGCGRKHRVLHPDVNHFESHAEMVGTHFDCAAWRETAKSMKDQFGAEVLTPPVPLTFGPTQNWVQQDALERRGVPRYMWAHADAAVDGPEPLTRLAMAAAAIRHPFCVLFSHYDIIAVFDAVSVTREVGDWDAHLWYHGDVDYYSRCRHAKLPWGEASGHDVHHVGKGSGTINAGGRPPKTKKRLDVMGHMYAAYNSARAGALDIGHFDLPPKGRSLVGAWVDYRDAVRIPSPTSELADVVSRHMGRWMFPYRFLVRRDGEEKDAGGGGVARVAVRLEYLPVDLEREDSPVRGDRALQELRASLVAATHADAADVYIPR